MVNIPGLPTQSGGPGVAIRTLMQTSLERWTWSQRKVGDAVPFVAIHDRSLDVILNKCAPVERECGSDRKLADVRSASRARSQRGEGFGKQVFRLVLAGCTKAGAGSVLDIGANNGYYSMASAAHGCPVRASDAQPGCKQWLEAARAANHHNGNGRRQGR